MINPILLIQPDCTWCADRKQPLAELDEDIPLPRVDEVDLRSDRAVDSPPTIASWSRAA
ncbi:MULTISPECIES: hypothetical protein [Bacteria]